MSGMIIGWVLWREWLRISYTYHCLKLLTAVVSLFANVIKSYTLYFINSSTAVEISQFPHWLGWCHHFYEPVSGSTCFLANPDFFRLKYGMPIFTHSKYFEAVSDPLCKYRYEVLDQWLHILYHVLGHSSIAQLFLYSNYRVVCRVAMHEVTQLNE